MCDKAAKKAASAKHRANSEALAAKLTPLSAAEGLPIEVKPLFGGWCLRMDGVTFGSTFSDGRVMWRIDDQSRELWDAVGAEPFIYTHANTGRVTAMPYRILPNLPDDPAELNDWAAAALAAARRAAKTKPKKPRKPKS